VLCARSSRTRRTPGARKLELKSQFGALTNRFAQLDEELNRLAGSKADAKKAVIEREKILKLLGDNREEQEPFDRAIKARGENMQLWQELGGLGGRIVLAVLLLAAISRGTLLRLFLVPGLIISAHLPLPVPRAAGLVPVWHRGRGVSDRRTVQLFWRIPA